MEVSFQRDLNKSYMLIRTEEHIMEDYQIRMICSNKVPALMELSVRQFNNKDILYYDISGKVSMENAYLQKKMTAEDIRMLMAGIQRLVENMQKYLLDMNKVLMDFAYIYIDYEKKLPEFCYYPYQTEDFMTSLRKVLNKIIKVADHTDRETVILSYGIQQLGSNESITISDLLKFVNTGDNYEENRQSVDGGNYLAQQEEPVEMDVCTDEKGQEIWERKKRKKKERTFAKKGIAGFFQSIRSGMEKGKRNYKNIEAFPEKIEEKEIFEKDNEKYRPESYNKTGETTLLDYGIYMQDIILKCISEEKTYVIHPDRFPFIVGKSRNHSDYVIKNNAVSGVHMRLIEQEDGYYIEDLASTNGTFLNGKRLKPNQVYKLNLGDTIKIAKIEYIVC